MAKITQEFAPSDSYTISELYNKQSGKSLIEFTAILEGDSEVPIKIIDKICLIQHLLMRTQMKPFIDGT